MHHEIYASKKCSDDNIQNAQSKKWKCLLSLLKKQLELFAMPTSIGARLPYVCVCGVCMLCYAYIPFSMGTHCFRFYSLHCNRTLPKVKVVVVFDRCINTSVSRYFFLVVVVVVGEKKDKKTTRDIIYVNSSLKQPNKHITIDFSPMPDQDLLIMIQLAN